MMKTYWVIINKKDGGIWMHREDTPMLFKSKKKAASHCNEYTVPIRVEVRAIKVDNAKLFKQVKL